MNTFLLDVAIEPTSNIFGSDRDVLWFLLVLLLVVIVIEAIIILLFKISKFGKSLLNSSIVNVGSTVIGYLLINKLDLFSEKISSSQEWLIFYGATVLIEGLLMMLLYRNATKGKLWLITVVMNLASYIFLYLISVL